jgi:hypothetical protein
MTYMTPAIESVLDLEAQLSFDSQFSKRVADDDFIE